jgi:hypothetical protein
MDTTTETRNRLPPAMLAVVLLAALGVRGACADDVAAAGDPAAAVAADSAKAAAPPVPLEFQPYRVRISVVFEPHPAMPGAFQEQVKHRMVVRIAQTFGLACVLDGGAIEPAGWLSPPDRAGLERLQEDEVRERLTEASIDKQFVVLVRACGPRFELSCREWDALQRSLGPIAEQETWERGDVGDAAVSLIARVFRPVYTVEDVDATSRIARVKVRAGSLPLGDPEQSLVHAGDILQPYFRYLDRNRALQRVQISPWTFLVVKQVEGPAATCSIVSGMRGGLGTGQRRRVEACAVRVQPMYRDTRVSMVLYSNRAKPLSGHQVLVTRRSPESLDAPADTIQAVTDRDGMLVLSRDDKLPLTWLAIRSGDVLLARVPVVPGHTPEAALELPDDSLRLAVERDLDLLKIRLIAAVARRATITSRALTLARAGDGANAQKILTEADQLPKIAEFESQLTAIRVPAVEAAQKKKDRVAESRINKLCTQASDLIRTYLAEDKLRVVQEEVKQLSEHDKHDKNDDPSAKKSGQKKSGQK